MNRIDKKLKEEGKLLSIYFTVTSKFLVMSLVNITDLTPLKFTPSAYPRFKWTGLLNSENKFLFLYLKSKTLCP